MNARNVANAKSVSLQLSCIDATTTETELPSLSKSKKPSRAKISPGPHRPEEFGITHDSIWGVYVNDGCVTGSEPLEWLTVAAHAHVLDDEWAGWICITGDVITSKGNPTHLLLHEVAHCIRDSRGHDAKWRRIVTDLGAGREAKKYERKRTSTPVVASPVAQP